MESFVDQFLKDVKDQSKDLPQKKFFELKEKAKKLLEAVCRKNLIIHDSGTYAMLFIVGPGPLYFDDFFQYRLALKMLLSFVEVEDCYFETDDEDLVEKVKYIALLKVHLRQSYEVYSYFFELDYYEQKRIEYSIENLRWMYSREGIIQQIEGLFESVEEELEYISGLLQDFKIDKNIKLFFGKEREIFEGGIHQLMAEKSAEKAIQNVHNQIKESFEEVNAYLDVFKPNGFRLFDYLMNNHLSSGKGWQSDISFFYRMMEKRDNFIHAKQKKFKEFLEKKYPYLEPMGKFKLWNDVESDKRMKIYTTAKKAIGLK